MFKLQKALIVFVLTVLLSSGLIPTQAQEETSAPRIYVLELDADIPTDEQVTDLLWSAAPIAPDDLKLAGDGRYLVGIEREITPADAEYLDRSYSEPSGYIVPQAAEQYALQAYEQVFVGGYMFPAYQTKLVYRGIIRWVWNEQISIALLEGRDIEFGVERPQELPSIDRLIPPLLRANEHERELQLVVEDGSFKLLRRVFVITAAEADSLDFDLGSYNTDHNPVYGLLPEVADEEKGTPDLFFEVTVETSSEQHIDFDQPESISASWMRCTTMDNSPDFVTLVYNFEGWKNNQIKFSVTITAADEVPAGDYFFRILHDCAYVSDQVVYPFRQERIAVVRVSSCTVQATGVNLRAGPGTNFERVGSLDVGSTGFIDGQTVGADGLVWLHLIQDAWVRSDVVTTSGRCEGMPELSAE
ncbi:MAG: SH3 domain-containing protein [Chloroflexi bacterium]|nr:SH3 domain-containing protein [Chloroflexota bacterium]